MGVAGVGPAPGQVWVSGGADPLEGAVGHRAGAPADRDGAGLDDLANAVRLQRGEQRLQLAVRAGRLDRHGVRGDVDDVRPEQLDDLQDGGAGGVVRPHLDEQELALDGDVRLQLDDLDDVDQLVQLLGHLLQRQLRGVDDHRDPGDLRVLGGADGEGVDVEGTAGEEGGDAREHAGLVLHQHGQGVTATHRVPRFTRRGPTWG